jgi:beta-glucosidase
MKRIARMKPYACGLAAGCLVLGACAGGKPAVEAGGGSAVHAVAANPNGGPVLGYARNSGLALLSVKEGKHTYVFKDMNANGALDVWEDWRKPADERAQALAEELSIDEIAGLMLFSSHEQKPEEGLTEAQKKYLKEDNLRNVLNAGANNVEAAVLWNNAMQAYVEGFIKEGKKVIPVNFSSDPRSTAGSDAQYNAGGEDISRWPSNLGLAATFDPEIMRTFARTAAEEYRGMGIATALGPQIELATDPRWIRFDGTFGEDARLAVDMAEAYVDGSQSTYIDGNDVGWGVRSINAMIKHFPGDGMGESGRESHLEGGKYAVYPGGNFQEHLKPFIDGGLNLTGKTKRAAAVMLSYSIGLGADGEPLFGLNRGSAYDQGKIDILRIENRYDGVLCTDWGVTTALSESPLGFGMAWGAEDLSVEERHYAALLAGMDMFGGNNDKQPILAAYAMWAADFGEASAKERFQTSGRRLLALLFNAGLFENPYLDLDASKAAVGSRDKREAGYQAQLASIVMLKNKDSAIRAGLFESCKDKTVYIPSSIHHNFPGIWEPASDTADPTMDIATAERYFKKVLFDTPIVDEEGTVTGFAAPDLADADMIIIGMRSPDSGGVFSNAGFAKDDGGFYPLSLQYRPYTALDGVREASISGDMLDDGSRENRSYYGKTSRISNEYDLDAFLNAKQAAEEIEARTGKHIPILVALKAKNPTAVGEFEAQADAIVAGFSVDDAAYFDILLGKAEPRGLLPMQFPQDMETVEANQEDVGRDMIPYTDEMGNVYDFAYGLNYSGVISDARTARYK